MTHDSPRPGDLLAPHPQGRDPLTEEAAQRLLSLPTGTVRPKAR